MDLETVNEGEARAQEEHEARLERCIPVAKKVLVLLSENIADVSMGKNDEVEASITPIAHKVLELLLAENILWTDKNLIMQLATQPIVFLNNALDTSYSISWDKVITKKFGKDVLDLTFKEVDDILKS